MAEYHRKLKLLESLPQGQSFLGQATTIAAPTNAIKYELPKVAVEAPRALSEQSKSNSHYIASDLVRIAILTALAICAQLVLWYRYR